MGKVLVLRALFVCLITSVALVSASFAEETATIEDEIRLAALLGDLETLEDITEKSAQKKTLVGQILPELATMADPKVIEFLAGQGVFLDATDEQGYTAVMRALEFGRVENAKTLQRFGANLSGISDDGYTVRLLAQQIGLDDFGRSYESSFSFQFGQKDADVLLLRAAETGDVLGVKFALENGADIDARSQNGWSAPMLAALGGHARTFEALFDEALLNSVDLSVEVDGVDLISAMLVGQGGNNTNNVRRMLRRVQSKHSGLLISSEGAYRALATKLDYSAEVIAVFPVVYEPLPPLETDIPIGRPGSLENWIEVQSILKAAGVYEGELDGKPGPQTQRALYAYYLPLLSVLRERSIQAAIEGKSWRSQQRRPIEQSTRVDVASPISAICVSMHTGTKGDRSIYNDVCGEFRVRNKRIANFAGYTFANQFSNWDNFRYQTAGRDYRHDESSLELIEYHRISDPSIHSQAFAGVLDKSFRIVLREESATFGFVDEVEQSVPGEFPRPTRPNF